MKRGITLLCSALMLVGVLAGCNSKSNEGGNPNPSPSVSEGESKGDTIDYKNNHAEINIFSRSCRGDWERKVLPDLQAEFPNYTFNFVSTCSDNMDIYQAVTTGIQFDMVYNLSAGELREDLMTTQLAYPMNDYLAKHGIDLNDFDEAYLDSVTIDGQVYMLPTHNLAFVMFYNKDIFERFGVEYPWNGMTWDEAAELAKKLTRNEQGKQYIGLWYSVPHILRVNHLSLGFVDPETNTATLNNEGWKLFFEKLFYNPTREPGLQARAKEKFFQHADFNRDYVIAMYVYTYGWISTHQTSLPPNWGVVSVPTFEKGGPGVQAYAQYVAMTSTSDNKDEVTLIMKYLTSPEYQAKKIRQGSVTVLKDKSVQEQIYADFPELADKQREIYEAIFYNPLAPSRQYHQLDEIVIEGAFYDDVIPEIVRGNMDMNTALVTAEEIANADLKAEMERIQ